MAAAMAIALACGGCLERRVSITTEPSGALVYANDVELGRTPLEADFTYYGKYDVRVEMEGYEPLRTRAAANAPIYEMPPFDLAAMAIPVDIETVIRWHFVLQPAAESQGDPREIEDGLMERARELRGMLGEPAGVAPPAERAATEEKAPDASTTPATGASENPKS